MKAQREKMEQLVLQWQDSGLSQSEFARKNQLKVHAFRYWVSKLRKDEDNAPAFISLDGFVTSQISLHFPNGVELTLPAQTTVSVLKGLIQLGNGCSR
jgi:hypothetical protein